MLWVFDSVKVVATGLGLCYTGCYGYPYRTLLEWLLWVYMSLVRVVAMGIYDSVRVIAIHVNNVFLY